MFVSAEDRQEVTISRPPKALAKDADGHYDANAADATIVENLACAIYPASASIVETEIGSVEKGSHVLFPEDEVPLESEDSERGVRVRDVVTDEDSTTYEITRFDDLGTIPRVGKLRVLFLRRFPES